MPAFGNTSTRADGEVHAVTPEEQRAAIAAEELRRIEAAKSVALARADFKESSEEEIAELTARLSALRASVAEVEKGEAQAAAELAAHREDVRRAEARRDEATRAADLAEAESARAVADAQARALAAEGDARAREASADERIRQADTSLQAKLAETAQAEAHLRDLDTVAAAKRAEIDGLVAERHREGEALMEVHVALDAANRELALVKDATHRAHEELGITSVQLAELSAEEAERRDALEAELAGRRAELAAREAEVSTKRAWLKEAAANMGRMKSELETFYAREIPGFNLPTFD